MPDDRTAASGLTLTRAEWRALRGIRRLQMASTLFFAGAFAGLLIVIVSFMREMMVTAEIGRSYYSIWDWIGSAIFVGAFACEEIVRGFLNRTICPRCSHEFFRVSPYASPQRRRTPSRRTSAFTRLMRITGQQCCNCELSLGLAAMPEPPESTASRG